MSSSEKKASPPRVRLAKHIDLTKAKPGCRKCNGRGITGYRRADLGDGEGERQIPIICRCVTRGGGVAPDELDRVLAEAKKYIDDGTFHEHVLADFHAAPDEQKPRIVAAFLRDQVDERKAPESKEAIEKVLDLMQRRKDWQDLRVAATRILMREASDPLASDESRDLAQRAMVKARASMN